MKAKKKPVVIDFYPIVSTAYDDVSRLADWIRSLGEDPKKVLMLDDTTLFVKTLEGTSYQVTNLDVVIRGIAGEYYPCKKTIFDETYEVIE